MESSAAFPLSLHPKNFRFWMILICEVLQNSKHVHTYMAANMIERLTCNSAVCKIRLCPNAQRLVTDFLEFNYGLIYCEK